LAGAVLEPVPVATARRHGVEKIVAVDVYSSLKDPHNPKDGIDVLYKTLYVMNGCLWNLQKKKWTVFLAPALESIRQAKWPAYEQLIQLGEQAARPRLDEIHSLMKEHPGADSPNLWRTPRHKRPAEHSSGAFGR
jgi:hypothetical protein